MPTWKTGSYRQIFQYTSYRSFWIGFTLSGLGDAMTRVALIWFVYESTHSAQALGWLTFAYTGPVVLGGLVAGQLLDRFDRRKVMFADNMIRGIIVALIPILYLAHVLALWHVYLVATVYGLLMMISLAGGPALIPALVPKQHLTTANALETFSFTLGGVVGPPLAGFLIIWFGAPLVVIFDAVSYIFFALMLLGIKVRGEEPTQVHTGPQPERSGNAVQLLLNNKILLSTTLMFMSFNLGSGFMNVWLPIYSDQVLGGGSQLYGILLGSLAIGEVLSSFFVGSLLLPLSLGTLICLSQFLSGASLSLVLLRYETWWTALGLMLLGIFSAPLTIWAQTLRMQIIPERLRGRTFALLRMLMQSSGPLGGAAAGLLLPLLGIPLMIGFSAFVIGVPGLLGYQIRQLRYEDRRITLEAV